MCVTCTYQSAINRGVQLGWVIKVIHVTLVLKPPNTHTQSFSLSRAHNNHRHTLQHPPTTTLHTNLHTPTHTHTPSPSPSLSLSLSLSPSFCRCHTHSL